MEVRKSDSRLRTVEASELLKVREADVKRLARLNEALVQQCESYMRTIAAMQNQEAGTVTQLETKCRDQEQLIVELQAQLDDYKLSRRTSDAMSVHDSVKISQLQAALVAADNEVKAQVKARMEVDSQLKRITDDLRIALRANATKEERLNQLEEANGKLHSENKSLQERMTAVRAVNEQLSKNASSLESKVHRLETQVKDNEISVSTVANLQKRVHTLTEQLAEARKEREKATVTEDAVEKVTAEKFSLLEEVARLRDKINKLETKVNSEEAGTPASPGDISGRTKAVFTAEGVKKREAEWQAERASMETRNKVLFEQVESLEKQLEESQMENAKLRQEVAFIKAAAPQPAPQVEELMSTLQAERTAHETQLAELDAVVNKLAEEQRAVESTLTNLRGENDNLISRLQAVSLERDHLKQALTSFANNRARSTSVTSSIDTAATALPPPTSTLTAPITSARRGSAVPPSDRPPVPTGGSVFPLAPRDAAVGRTVDNILSDIENTVKTRSSSSTSSSAAVLKDAEEFLQHSKHP